ncbi:MAG: hypothetical protein ACRDGH_10430 [Candidatus Limnocylindria bacterium]
MSNVTNVLILAGWERDAMDALTNSARRWDDTAPWRGYFGSISRQLSTGATMASGRSATSGLAPSTT